MQPSEPRGEWRSTGHAVRVDIDSPEFDLAAFLLDRIPPYDPRSGEHLWSWAVLYRAAPDKLGDPTHTPILDMENLLSVAGPGCYYCEAVYTPLLASRRCPGDQLAQAVERAVRAEGSRGDEHRT